MAQSNWELWGIIIAIIEFDINYYVYSATGSLLNILFIAVASLILILAFVLSNVYLQIKSISLNQEETEQKLIRYKELEDIRLDLREIKKELLKRQ